MIPYSLNDDVATVPRMSRPVYWDLNQDVHDNLSRIHRWIAHYADKLPSGAKIDEAAVMVPGPYEGVILGKVLREWGWELFNDAQDIVYTNPFGTRYAVQYFFYQHPELPYRLEIMAKDHDTMDQSGFSPLHSALWFPNGRVNVGSHLLPIPHLSFKMPGDPTRRGFSKAVQHLQDKACLHAMSCQSTYGVFSYYIGNDTARQIYLKPRCNLRDIPPVHATEEVFNDGHLARPM